MEDKSEDLMENWNEDLGTLYAEAETVSNPVFHSMLDISQRYKNKVLIGEGGEKKVFKVYDCATAREIAFAEPVNASKKDYEHFLREARILSYLQHPNIIPVYDIGFVEEKPYFTMELAGGKNLKDLLNESGLDDLLDIFVQICDAVAYAHSKGVLNLDLKPENIKVDVFSKVLVLDWGLAKNDKSQGDDADFSIEAYFNEKTLRGSVKGTPGFMAPEQVSPDGQKTVLTDIYLLGAVLFCILYKKPPVSGDSLEEIIEKTLAGDLVDVNKKNIPAALQSICRRAMALNEQDRYSAVQHMRDDVVKYRRGFATDAEKAGFFKQLVLLYKRNILVSNIILTALFLTVTLTALFIHQLRVRENEANAAKQQAEQLLELYEGQKLLSSKMEDGINQAIDSVLANGRLNEAVEELLLKSTYSLSGNENYDSAMVFVLRLLKHNPEYKEAWRHLGFLYFIRFNFKSSAECFKKGPESDICRKMIAVSEKYSELYDGGDLNNDGIYKLLTEDIRHEKWSWTQKHILLLNRINSKSEAEHLNLLKKVIKFYNKNAEIRCKYENGVLSFKGSKMIKTLLFPDSYYLLISSLDLKKVDLTGCGKVKGINILKEHSIKVLY